MEEETSSFFTGGGSPKPVWREGGWEAVLH